MKRLRHLLPGLVTALALAFSAPGPARAEAAELARTAPTSGPAPFLTTPQFDEAVAVRKITRRRPRSVLTLRQATELFQLMASYRDISFRFPTDGCYARCHLMVRRMQAMGYRAAKVWSFARSKKEPLFCRTPNDPRGYVSWKYHVAPTVRVRIKKKVYALVIDPSMFDRPVKISQWARAQRRNRTSRIPFVCKTRVGQPPRRPNGRRTSGTGYWPSADPRRGTDRHAVRVMKLFKPWEGRSAPKKVLKRVGKL
jgi:hypothetical protein